MTGIEADVLGRQLSLHLRRNNFEACHEILESKEREVSEERGLPKAIAELSLDLKTVNLLEGLGHIYVRDLVGIDFRRLQQTVPWMGERMVEKLEYLVSKFVKEINKRRRKTRLDEIRQAKVR